MFKKNCRCGASNKNFKFDIGPFFIDACCTQAGYDDLGNRAAVKQAEQNLQKLIDSAKNPAPSQRGGPASEAVLALETPASIEDPAEEPQEQLPPGPSEGEAPEESPEQASALRAFFGLGQKLKAGGRGKLMDMTVEQLKVMAKEKGIAADSMNKKQIVAALLEKANG